VTGDTGTGCLDPNARVICVLILIHSALSYGRPLPYDAAGYSTMSDGNALAAVAQTVRNIAFYVTGHGLGHATRALGIINALLQTRLYNIHIVSSVPASFFESNIVTGLSPGTSSSDAKGSAEIGALSLQSSVGSIGGLYQLHHRTLDTGAIQSDALTVDPVETIRRYHSNVHIHRDDMLSTEVSFLTDNNIDLVLVDATPLACMAARLAGKRSVVISNFTWDYCYRAMLDTISDSLAEADRESYQNMVDQSSEDYNGADHYIQLPGQTPLPPGFHADRVIAGPLIYRPSVRTAEEMLTDFRIPSDSKVLVLGFGGHKGSNQWILRDEYLPSGWVCLVLAANGLTDFPSSRFIPIPFDAHIPDVIAVADVMIGKLGYGTCSECLTNNTPLIYLRRSNWPEEQSLERLMLDNNAAVVMPESDFIAGAWESYLNAALALQGSWTMEDINAHEANDRVVGIINTIAAK
jgi:L-arabinokinase